MIQTTSRKKALSRQQRHLMPDHGSLATQVHSSSVTTTFTLQHADAPPLNTQHTHSHTNTLTHSLTLLVKLKTGLSNQHRFEYRLKACETEQTFLSSRKYKMELQVATGHSPRQKHKLTADIPRVTDGKISPKLARFLKALQGCLAQGLQCCITEISKKKKNCN